MNLTLAAIERNRVTAAVLVVISLFVPLWHMTFVAQQYPEGLDLWIYSHDLIGGDETRHVQGVDAAVRELG